jgi:L-fuconolactonase
MVADWLVLEPERSWHHVSIWEEEVTTEAIPDPDLPIIDPHHHLYPANHWVSDGGPFLLQEFAKEIAGGHNIIATVYVECSQLYRQTGPEHLRSTGEAEFAAVTARVAEAGHFGATRFCEGFVGYADLAMGDAVGEMLDALTYASDGRLRGIRCPANWDPDPQINPSSRPFAPEGLMGDAKFREGIARITAHGLVYDAWQYFPQLGELAKLAAAMPNTTFVCGHCGGLVGNRAYSGPDNFANWKTFIVELAKRPNVVMKLGGMANERTGFGFASRALQSTEAELIALWGPYFETCIEVFGADRCMFESNFPVDMIATDYRSLWTIFKKVANGASAGEKAALFAGTARRVYKLS